MDSICVLTLNEKLDSLPLEKKLESMRNCSAEDISHWSSQAQFAVSTYPSVSIVCPIPSDVNGVWGVGMPCANIVELWFGRLEIDVLRSHVAILVFWMFEWLKLDSRCDFRWSLLSAIVPGRAKHVITGSCTGTFSCCFVETLTRNNGFGGMVHKTIRWGAKKRASSIITLLNLPS